jgi:hypothetical protein
MGPVKQDDRNVARLASNENPTTEAGLPGRCQLISIVRSRVRSPFSLRMRPRWSWRATQQSHRAARGPHLSDRFQRPTGTHRWDLSTRPHPRDGHRERVSADKLARTCLGHLVSQPTPGPLGQPEKAIGHESPIEPWLTPDHRTACWFQNGMASSRTGDENR